MTNYHLPQQMMLSQEDSLGDVRPGPGVGHEGNDHGGDQPTPQVHLHWRGNGDDDDDVADRHNVSLLCWRPASSLKFVHT